MAPSVYKPLTLDVRMSDYGYWVVSVSVAPGRVVSVMIASTGISSEVAREHALTTLAGQVRGITQ
jgi:hypothetical protein